jgi:hypothetical protein
MPVSNVRVGEQVIEQALENSGIPGGNGTVVLYTVNQSGFSGNLLDILVPEFLLKKGYTVTKKKGFLPEFTFNLDTLYVNLDRKHLSRHGSVVRRYSEARINAVFKTSLDFSEVYAGRGIFSDIIRSKDMKYLGSNENFVHQIQNGDGVIGKIKPVFTGVAVTILMWLLYSYRS